MFANLLTQHNVWYMPRLSLVRVITSECCKCSKKSKVDVKSQATAVSGHRSGFNVGHYITKTMATNAFDVSSLYY